MPAMEQTFHKGKLLVILFEGWPDVLFAQYLVLKYVLQITKVC